MVGNYLRCIKLAGAYVVSDTWEGTPKDEDFGTWQAHVLFEGKDLVIKGQFSDRLCIDDYSVWVCDLLHFHKGSPFICNGSVLLEDCPECKTLELAMQLLGIKYIAEALREKQLLDLKTKEGNMSEKREKKERKHPDKDYYKVAVEDFFVGDALRMDVLLRGKEVKERKNNYGIRKHY